MIYCQRECPPKCVYFVTRGGVIEKRDEVNELPVAHKIG